MELVEIVLDDPDDDGARARLAADPVAVAPHLGRLLDAGVLEPPALYRHASDEVRRRLVAAVDLGAPDRPLRSYLDALACAGGPIAEAAFRRWRDETPPNVGDGYDFAIERHGSIGLMTIGSEALIPNPALRPLAALVGEWRTTGTHGLMPGTTFLGRASFAWHEGGAFLIMRTEIDQPEIPSGVALFGSDDQAGSYTMLYFDERGISRTYDVTVTADGLTWQRDEAGFAQRNTITIGGDRMEGRGEMRRDGGDWEPDLALTYVRS